jgi:cell division protein FtsW
MRTSEQNIDRILLGSVIILIIFGIWLVFSATIYLADLKYNSAVYYLERHIIRSALGLFVMILLIALLDYRKLREYAFLIFAVAVLLMVLTLIFGDKRWLKIGPLILQPSEFAKLALLIYLAHLVEKNRERLSSFKLGFLPLISVVFLVSALALIQKSFTMSFLIFISGLFLIYFGGARFRHIAIVLIATIPLGVLAVLIEPYRVKRLLSYFGEGMPYQTMQALIGLGNGGLFGVGPGHSRQRELFLPLAYNDYIFSILGEEYGFIGALFVIFIFFVIFYRGFKIAESVYDDFGKLLAGGITFMIFLTTLVHIGVVLGLPATGIPLPFISYGGSSMIANCIAVGILLNISKQVKTLKR